MPCISFAFIPKALNNNLNNGRSSDLLAFEAFPLRFPGKVTSGFKSMKRAYSSGNCTGFTPDSLLCLSSGQMKYGTIADTKVGKITGDNME